MNDSRHAVSLASIAAGLALAGNVRGQALFDNVTTAAGLGGYIATTGDGHGPGGVFADLNNDGFADLYLMQAGFASANRMFLNIPGANGQRRFAMPVDSAGDTGNAGSTSSLELEFGLGPAGGALLEILWPSGGFSSVLVSPNQFLVIDEANLVPGDLTADGIVSIQDFLVLLFTWGVCPGPPVGCPGDLDGDGEVGIVDLLIVLGNWTAG